MRYAILIKYLYCNLSWLKQYNELNYDIIDNNAHYNIMTIRISSLAIVVVCMMLPYLTCSSQQCIGYLQQLQNLSITNRIQFIHQMTPYLVLSGKTIDDLGFPGSCEKDVRKYRYSTVQVQIQTNVTTYTGYLGFCFTQLCPVEDLNQFAQFIIDFIFAQYQYGVSGKFIDPPLQLEFSPLALTFCLIFTLFIVAAMLAPIKQWINMCRQTQDQYEVKSVYIDLQNPNNQLDEERITERSSLLERLSLKYKWKQLWKEETTYNIWSFSMFRVFAVPLLLYGQIFWLTNFGAYNYYAFYEEIYEQFYVKFAIFAYYMPDIFFFISGFLFTKKVISFHDDEYKNLLKSVGWKLLRLYPLYIAVFVIYWCISPALHAGPVWYVYQNQAQVCNTAWWRVLLMIDNWFAEGCYPGLWFVQVEVQFVLCTTLLFFSVYLSNKKVGLSLLVIYIVAALTILFVFQDQMLVSVQIAIDPYTQLYFKSFYSHIFFYLIGVLFAVLAQKESIRIAIQQYILDKQILSIGLKIISVGILILILLRPWVWWGHSSLKLEMTFCRLGTLLCYIILFSQGMFVHETNTSVIHKYGYYMYPVILVSYMIAQSSFWSVGSFMYVSGYDILNEMVPNFLISYSVGIFLGILFDTRTLITSSVSSK